MRVSFPCLITLLVLSFGASVLAQTAFSTNLTLGSRGAQVIALQQMLNQDPDTQIAGSGMGSKGYETDYFGLLTQKAVIRFQNKYASEVVAPAGLAQGNGYVGSYTRAKLNALSALKTSAMNADIPAAAPPPASPAPAVASQNPNLKNIDKVMAALDATAAKQGITSEKLAIIKAAVLKEAATTTDLRAAFLKQAAYAHQAVQDDSYGGKILATIEQAFNSVFMPAHAQAAVAAPFGGALLFPIFCTQSATWLLAIQPLPPTYATLLTYVPFTEAFLSYNIPVTNELLGYYVPGAGVCIMGVCPACTYVPSWGMITPMVGSSPA